MKHIPGTSAPPRRAAGVTLIELVITLAILGILATVSYASYSNYILKANRSVAKSALLDAATRQERFYASNRRYTTSMSELGYPTSPTCFGKDGSPLTSCSVAGNIYSVRTEDSCDGGPLPCFKVTATPFNMQNSDTCGTFRIFSTNVRDAATSGCW
ncbi:MAG: type IV pilin protein [Pseudomonadota bacterium]